MNEVTGLELQDMKEKPKAYLKTQQVAEMLMVSPITVRQWAQKGDLHSSTTPGGHRRFFLHDIENFARKHRLTISPDIGGELRVLVVDDDKQFNFYLTELINESGADVAVESAEDGFVAGRKVQTFNPNVILLDLMMPGLNGFEVCRLLKEDPITKSVRIIAITGYFNEENEQKILSLGAEVCLPKPVKPEVILDLLGIREKKAQASS